MIAERNIAVVCNPQAGAGRAIALAHRIAAELKTLHIQHTVFQNNWPDGFSLFSDVWIAGGDGTLNFFINKYPEIKLPLVIFKGGSGNDVHSILYGNKNFEEQMLTALNAKPQPVDAGRCNENYFINGVGIGFEGAVAKSLAGKKKREGKTSFMGAVLRKIFFYRSKKYRVISDECNASGHQLLVSVMNGHRAGGGFHIAPSSAINDGLLDVVMVKRLHPFLRLRWLPVIEKGEHLGLSFIKHFRTKKIIITSEKDMDAHLDGEYYTAKRLEIEMWPGKFLFCY